MTTDPFTRIHNTVLDALMQVDLSGAESRVILAIWRKTYGFQKTQDKISVSLIVKMTSLAERTTHNVLKSLITKKIINRTGTMTSFSKEFMKLNLPNQTPAQNGRVSKMAVGGVQNGGNGVSKMAPTKETIKRNSLKERVGAREEQGGVMGEPALSTKVVQPIVTLTSDSNLTPLTYDELYAIADKKNVSLKAVERVHQSVLDSIEDGDKYKVKSISRTVYKWLAMRMDKGQLEEMNELERMLFDTQSPAEKKIEAELLAKRERLKI